MVGIKVFLKSLAFNSCCVLCRRICLQLVFFDYSCSIPNLKLYSGFPTVFNKELTVLLS